MVVDFLMFQNNFLCINSGLKYSFGGSLNKIGQVAFALVLGPHNKNIVRIQTDIILKPLYQSQGSFKQIFPLKTQNQILLKSLYFLYTYNREDSKIIIRTIPSDVGRYMCYKPSCLFQLCPHLAWQTSFYLFGTLGIVWVFIWLVFHNENTTLDKDEIPLFVPKVNFPYSCWISVVWTATIAIHFIHYILIS